MLHASTFSRGPDAMTRRTGCLQFSALAVARAVVGGGGLQPGTRAHSRTCSDLPPPLKMACNAGLCC